MFTGLIVETGEIIALNKKGTGAFLSVSAKAISENTAIGDSIAVNGVCLTVITINGKQLSFDLSDETLNSTNLGELRPGDKVNLEPSLRPDGKLGGHFVTGHIDGVGKIMSKRLDGDISKITIGTPPEIASLLVEKGSVAVDGISLTVVDIFEEAFTVVIIPHTSTVTTIGLKNTEDTVNLEADIIGKYVAKFLGKDKRKDDRDKKLMDSLTKAGYV